MQINEPLASIGPVHFSTSVDATDVDVDIEQIRILIIFRSTVMNWSEF